MAFESDGLWTARYLAEESFRWAMTKDPTAKRNADQAFAALEFLTLVTGIPGLPSRTVKYDTEEPITNVTGWWHESFRYPGWLWMGDTSSCVLSSAT